MLEPADERRERQQESMNASAMAGRTSAADPTSAGRHRRRADLRGRARQAFDRPEAVMPHSMRKVRKAMQKVFIVEDDVALCAEVRTLLESYGYETDVVRDFACAAQEALAASPDLVLLDLSLPQVDGHVVCREIRRASDVPIIVMTSRDNDLDELLALNTGADDFIAKPFNPQVFLAHIAAHLRRGGEAGSAGTMTHAGVELDAARGTVSFEGAVVGLTRNEISLLSVLMRRAGTIVSRAQLSDELWQTDQFVDDNTLTVNVTRLRASLSSIGVPDGFLQTRRGMGYLIV